MRKIKSKKITKTKRRRNPDESESWFKYSSFPEPEQIKTTLTFYKKAIIEKDFITEKRIEKAIFEGYKNLYNEYITRLWQK